ncbi:MAG: fatty acid desaturase [Acidimicrobiia bacterium]|nr:fatty acid desaturase [Acidimicrobiia bacterium]
MTAVVRDYGLVGEDSRLAIDRGLVEAEWFRPPIDPERLTALQVRTNARAARDTILWLGLLGVFGYLAFRALGSWWAAPAFMAYGALYGGAGDSRWHECGHGTAFRTKWLNDVVYYIASFMLLRQPTLWRWSHVRHHTDTIVVGRDPEIMFPRPSNLPTVLGVYLPVVLLPKAVWRTIKHAAGRIDDDARDFIPTDELPKLKWESRAYIAVLAGTAVWCVAIGSIVPALYVGLPTFYGAWLMVFFGALQHAGLREDVLDHRYNSRTVYMNPILRFLYSNMNYHVEHHIFPTVPYYALPALHQEIKQYLAPADSSTISAYRRIFATLRRQWRDPTYDDPRPDVPEVSSPERTYVNTGLTAWAGDVHDGMIDLGPAEGLAPGSARRVDRGDATYALYRLDPEDLDPEDSGEGDPSSEFVLSDGLCTHGQAHLAEGAVLDCMVECPKHNGCFDLRTGEALRYPATEPITLYDVTLRNGRVVSRLAPRDPVT